MQWYNLKMMKKGWQNLFLILFALLQCVAPLAHAHVDGVDAAPNLYSHEVSSVGLQMHEAHLENQLGAVVSVTQAAPFSLSLWLDEPDLASPCAAYVICSSALPAKIFAQLNQVLFRTHLNDALASPQAPPQKNLQ